MCDTPNARELKAIIDWINVTDDIREFSLTYGDVQLHVSRNTTAGAAFQAAPPPPQAPVVVDSPKPVAPQAQRGEQAQVPTPSQGAESQLAEDEVLVKAPMVGTFYAAPKPGQPDFVRVGEAVKPDTVLCIVEVMKLMNNIKASVEGTVARILVRNEQAVQYGQPLMVIKRA